MEEGEGRVPSFWLKFISKTKDQQARVPLDNSLRATSASEHKPILGLGIQASFEGCLVGTRLLAPGSERPRISQ
jgi:hypothetical protein